jgi:hypothetical protein
LQQQQQQQISIAHVVAPCLHLASTDLVTRSGLTVTITVTTTTSSSSSFLQGPALLQGGLDGPCGLLLAAVLGQIQRRGVDTLVVQLVGPGQHRQSLTINVGQFLRGYGAAVQHSSHSSHSKRQRLLLGATQPSGALLLLPWGGRSAAGRLPALMLPATRAKQCIAATSRQVVAQQQQQQQQRLRQLQWAAFLAAYSIRPCSLASLVQALSVLKPHPASRAVGFLPCIDIWYLAAFTTISSRSGRRRGARSLQEVVCSMAVRLSCLPLLDFCSIAAATPATISSSSSRRRRVTRDPEALLCSMGLQVSCLECWGLFGTPWSLNLCCMLGPAICAA